MKRKNMYNLLIVFGLVLALLGGIAVALRVQAQGMGPQVPLSPQADPLGTEFTYQGRLIENDVPVDGVTCTLTFDLYEAASGGSPLDTYSDTAAIEDGYFSVALDFGDVFKGDARWLEASVQCPGDSAPVPLDDRRMALTAAPYALYALGAPWSGLSNVPPDFADGVDDVSAVVSGTNVFAGDGLTQVSAGNAVTMAVDFGGNGSATTVARSDHDHDTIYSLLGHTHPGSAITSAVPTATLALSATQAPWTGLVGVPADLSDGDDDTTYAAGTGLELASGAFSITPTYRLPQACADGQIAEWNDTTSLWECGDDDTGAGGNYWSLTGNADTDPSANFLGTTDNVSLTLAVSGTAALRIEPVSGGTSAPNLIGGHPDNSVTGSATGATIAGGGNFWNPNVVSGTAGTVGGGAGNTASGDQSTVGGGQDNTASGRYATIGGGEYVSVTGVGATVAGGSHITVTGDYAAVGGGESNLVTATYGTIGGGEDNLVGGAYGTIGGGWSNTTRDYYSTVGGGTDNTASGNVATVGGGTGNTASSSYSTVGGGASNYAGGITSTIGGGSYISVTGVAATVAGGSHITVTGNYAAVGGGYGNTASGIDATVSGGTWNQAVVTATTIGGGESNLITATHGTIAGGRNITVTSEYASVGGGASNKASGKYATVSGGASNDASGASATVGGGALNTASSDYATVSGGIFNTASGGHYATVSGGTNNTVNNQHATIGGGGFNTASGSHATIGGGVQITATGQGATVGGGESNLVTAIHGTIAGGYNIAVTGDYAAVGGGYNNVAGGVGSTVGGGGYNGSSACGNWALASASTIGGGHCNLIMSTADHAAIGGGGSNRVTATHGVIAGGYNITVTGNYAAVGGGQDNNASGQEAFIGGGLGNQATGTRAMVGSGWYNTASNNVAVVGGGASNTASGEYSTVPGGSGNTAAGNFSFAAGRRAQANNQGCFVWGDSTNSDVVCNDNDRWIARASGGVYFFTNSSHSTGVYLASGGETWQQVSSSDRTLKENFEPVDGQEILIRLADVPITTWNYKASETGARHIGPMAQDFYAAFSVGEDDKHLAALDTNGVALAAIQALHEQNQALQAENAELRDRVDDLEARMDALEEQVNRETAPTSSRLLPGGWAGLLALAAVAGVWAWRR